ncbi:polysaccharide pyruvyl transferase family protein [Thiohalomonas denitrificans]|uniref:Polysaccharide pyruvyl transferase CsaB n=1 Tax=Thiohalomonas denitrificans TaxID=415747 RepID=A0A1G5Q3X3_9GAMM|nr:polysaccharide pyruvyl transferase family protein [Thiohalomonas denitrificans]SCZ56387.1 polysaccharide pyruvyl transferase CsaB [Thiohalomonas denitrificans]
MTRNQYKYRIGITGSYGGLNLGDEAILQSIVTQLRESTEAEITVFSRDREDTRQRHAVDHAISTRRLSRDELSKLVEGLDLLIVGGGGLLFDAEARTFLREATLAQELGVPVMVYAIGAGPLRDAAVQTAVREVLDRTEVITVREAAARQVLEETGVRHDIQVTADPALLLKPEPLPRQALASENLKQDGPMVGMSVREPGAAAPDVSQDVYHQLLANAADYMVDRFGAQVVFIPMERGVLDMQHSHAVISKMLCPQSATVLKGEYTSGQLLTLIGHFDFAVGMRLHFLILAALGRVPFVALPYATKVGGFLEQIGAEMPPIDRVNAGRLLAHIDRSWDRRRSLANRIDRTVPMLQDRARESHRILMELLQRHHPG